MHAKPDLRVVFNFLIYRSGSVIASRYVSGLLILVDGAFAGLGCDAGHARAAVRMQLFDR